jgi:hypothetical protein
MSSNFIQVIACVRVSFLFKAVSFVIAVAECLTKTKRVNIYLASGFRGFRT